MLDDDFCYVVLWVNFDCVNYGFVVLIFGNVSGIDRVVGCILIKFLGVFYDWLSVGDMVVCDLDGWVLDNWLCLLFDLQIYVVLYCVFFGIGGVVYMYLIYVMIMVQVWCLIFCLGMIYVDYFYGIIFVMCDLMLDEIVCDYVLMIGEVIVEIFVVFDLLVIFVVLVVGYGFFVWGCIFDEVVYNVLIFEEVVCMVWYCMVLDLVLQLIIQVLLDWYYLCKYGVGVIYGQGQL